MKVPWLIATLIALSAGCVTPAAVEAEPATHDTVVTPFDLANGAIVLTITEPGMAFFVVEAPNATQTNSHGVHLLSTIWEVHGRTAIPFTVVHLIESKDRGWEARLGATDVMVIDSDDSRLVARSTFSMPSRDSKLLVGFGVDSNGPWQFSFGLNPTNGHQVPAAAAEQPNAVRDAPPRLWYAADGEPTHGFTVEDERTGAANVATGGSLRYLAEAPGARGLFVMSSAVLHRGDGDWNVTIASDNHYESAEGHYAPYNARPSFHVVRGDVRDPHATLTYLPRADAGMTHRVTAGLIPIPEIVDRRIADSGELPTNGMLLPIHRIPAT